MAAVSQNIFNNQFVIQKKISSGSFGVVYQGFDLRSSDHVAIKVEKQEIDDLFSLDREIQILRTLFGIPQVPKLKWAGKDKGNNVMVIQLLGRDLTHYLRQRKRFSLACVLSIADQMLTILEAIHSKGIIHRDIKPENILAGKDREQNTIYLVDYGIAKQFKDKDDKHIPFRENKPFLGTSRYASIAAHRGQELSRKDDLESLGYIFLLKGSLPWQSISYKNEDEKVKIVGLLKMRITSQELCQDTPTEFMRFIDLVKKMSYREKPDYRYFQQLFRRVSIQYRGMFFIFGLSYGLIQYQIIRELLKFRIIYNLFLYILKIECRFDWYDENNYEKKSGSTSPRKQQSIKILDQSYLIQQIYTPNKKKLSEEFDDTGQSKRESNGRLSIINNNSNNLLQCDSRMNLKNKSGSSYNGSNLQYSDVQPDVSCLIAYQRNLRYGSFHNEIEPPKQPDRSTSAQDKIKVKHKLSLDVQPNCYKSIAEFQLGLIDNPSNMDFTVNSQNQMNEDESPCLDDKFSILKIGSIDKQKSSKKFSQFKNPIQLFRLNLKDRTSIKNN